MAEQQTPEPRFAGFESVPIRVNVRVAETRCPLARLSELDAGDVIELEHRVGEPFELRAGKVLLARVEPVVENDAVALKLVEIPKDDHGLGS